MAISTGPIQVLLIDDDRADYVITRDMLESIPGSPYALTWAPNSEEALRAFRETPHDVILLDYLLGETTGVDVLRHIRQQGIEVPIIMLTAVEDRAVDQEALAAGADEYLTKASATGLLLDRTIRYAVEKRRLQTQIVRSRDDVRSILDELRTGTAITSADGMRVSFVSRAFEKLAGIPRQQILGAPWTDALPVTEADRNAIREQMALPSPQRVRLPLHWETGQGTRYWTELEVLDEPRDAARKILVLYDVSDIHGLRRLLDGRAEFCDIIGKSESMQTLFQQIGELARYDTTVMIEGETGTGKELVARAIHFSGHRSGKPFIAVNCAGLTESILASQLFGHKKGAFTGAVSDHIGYFEAAEGGTLFLDEIGDIPPVVQTMLLRVVQEREIVRVGESTPRTINVRLLSATNRDLNREVAEGRFRSDLLYRVRVARLTLPPLRARREDIPVLVTSFLRRFTAKTGKQVEAFSPGAASLLMSYSWPGNVRELQNAVEAAAISCRGTTVQPGDLPPEIAIPQSAFLPQDGLSGQRLNLGRFDEFSVPEGLRIEEALAKAGGNRAKAARLLGISRTTLYRRLAAMKS
ncbi:MAG: sigma 54-interacting transcriptional regulator [Candidatus Hydrogenedentes bacterium]|nr:sigma 54-interacting transcriptional regulator [Candidatus Hydrogenedentota bacterium]